MKSNKAVLVIHSFAGGIWENEYLVNYLQYYYNYDVYASTLPGHTKTIIRKIHFQEWISAPERDLKNLIKKYDTIYLIGHSMGGVIATHLATKYKEVKKLVLLAPAYEYPNLKRNIKDIKQFIFRDKNRIKIKEENYKGILYKIIKLPIPTLLEFRKLVNKYKNYPRKIKCPTLILHGDYDELVPISSSEYVFNSIKYKLKYFTIVKKMKHRMLNSYRKEEVSEYIGDFLEGGKKWNTKIKSEL